MNKGQKLHAWASLVSDNSTDTTADAYVNNASVLGAGVLFEQNRAWWSAYWPQSFITIPLTRLESFYYLQMYRFVASDRVTLHGLDGAFGPSGMTNLWPDDVWDMNEEVANPNPNPSSHL